ncbi:hypothetical protein Goarm_019223 [Gossypium armourianum]|uniref:Uncharacterized protein n=1 Tax=Gossypium armourianum TaxID=34283 RepID=A0A7J9IJW7_9ROSI|nr:hypothetical protein [Gossypium armourianum]
MRMWHNREGEPSLEIGKGKAKVDEEASDSSSVTDRRLKRAPKEGRSHNCRRLKNLTAFHDLKQLLVVKNPLIVFFSKTKATSREVEHVRLKCNMDGCFVVEAEGRCRGLDLL